jgi:hypothetical protein
LISWCFASGLGMTSFYPEAEEVLEVRAAAVTAGGGDCPCTEGGTAGALPRSQAMVA